MYLLTFIYIPEMLRLRTLNSGLQPTIWL